VGSSRVDPSAIGAPTRKSKHVRPVVIGNLHLNVPTERALEISRHGLAFPALFDRRYIITLFPIALEPLALRSI